MCYPLFDYCLFIVIIVIVLFGFSVIAEEEQLQAPVLQASECAASYQPPPAGPALTPTLPTSGTRATPAATLALPVDHVQLPSVKHQTTSVSLGKEGSEII